MPKTTKKIKSALTWKDQGRFPWKIIKLIDTCVKHIVCYHVYIQVLKIYIKQGNSKKQGLRSLPYEKSS
jgi:hypothetical protein